LIKLILNILIHYLSLLATMGSVQTKATLDPRKELGTPKCYEKTCKSGKTTPILLGEGG